MGRTRGVLPPADLDELLDVGDFARHDGRSTRDGDDFVVKEVVRLRMEDTSPLLELRLRAAMCGIGD